MPLMRMACQGDVLAAAFGLGQMMATAQVASTSAQVVAVGEQEVAVAMFRSVFEAPLRLGSECASGCGCVCTLGWKGEDLSRVFRARADQVRKVREFVRAALAGHPAVDDTVLVASELAADSVAHSRSGRDGGSFVVHLAEVSASHVAVLLTELRSPTAPAGQDPGLGAESGRGLAVVRSLTSLFRVADVGDVRSLLAVIPAAAPPGERRCPRARRSSRPTWPRHAPP